MSTSCVRATVLAALSIWCLGACGSDSTTTDNTTTTSTRPVSAALASAIADAQRMAPALESKLRGTPYPTTLDGAHQALTAAGIEPTPGNVVDGYEYDPKTVEFRLCIAGANGSYAVYDTRPMSLFTTGETGGCPSSSR